LANIIGQGQGRVKGNVIIQFSLTVIFDGEECMKTNTKRQ